MGLLQYRLNERVVLGFQMFIVGPGGQVFQGGGFPHQRPRRVVEPVYFPYGATVTFWPPPQFYFARTPRMGGLGCELGLVSPFLGYRPSAALILKAPGLEASVYLLDFF